MRNNKNWLILSGGLLLSTSMFLTIFLDLNPHYNKLGFNNTQSFFLNFFLFPILIAPVLEELIFRGFLSKLKIIRILFLLVGLIFLVFSFNTLFLILAIITYSSFIYYKIKKIDFFLDLTIILSAFMFSLMHYSIQDLYSFEILPFLVGKFSLGLILSWITYNKDLFVAIIGHSIWNTTIILITLVGLQFIDNAIVKSRYNDSFIIYNKVPILSSNVSSYEIKENELITKNMTVIDVIKYMNKSYLDTFIVANPYMKYDIHVWLEDANEIKDFNYGIIQILEKEELIIKRDH